MKMSLSKDQSIEDNYRRDSFSDRVCDDLCRHIIQFLPPKDKLRLECVSKQFQRNIFSSQRKLAIDYLEMQNDMNWVKKFETLLRKLSSIKSFQYKDRPLKDTPDGQTSTDPKQNEMTEMIIKYSNNLTHFDSNLLRFVDKDIQMKFIEKFGHKLLSVSVDTHFLWSLNQMPNIEELTITSDNNQIPDIQFKRLKRLSICNLRLDMDLNEFKAFIERNDKTITHLDIVCQSKEDQLSDNFQLILTIVSVLKNLVHLKISSDFAFNDNSFTKQLIQMALNSNQLESLSIDYELDPNVGPNWDQYLALRRFKRLKRLNLRFVTKTVHSLTDYLRSNQFFAFKGMEALPHLTHLSLSPRHSYYGKPEVNETIFTDIDINLPKLQSLIIRGMKMNVKESTVVMLSRLSRLESIELCIAHNENRDFNEYSDIMTAFMKNFKLVRLVFNWSHFNIVLNLQNLKDLEW